MSGGGYKLRCSLLGHSKDVRAVATTRDGRVITASRDSLAKLWGPAADGIVYEEKVLYKGHSSYVTSVCVVEGDAQHPEGLVVTGSRDSTILVFSLDTGTVVHTLTGHTDTVSCLSVGGGGLLVSGSWDLTGRLWRGWQYCAELKGHTGPLWSVSVVPGAEDCQQPRILTASADKTIKLWLEDKVERTYSGHKDCVRGLAVLSRDRFMSCSNDATVILWAISGEALSTFFGHTNFIYSLASLSESGGFVTGGEDRTLRVWDSAGNCSQTLHQPAQSVWAVAALPNSDIVCGSSDGVCRIFTKAAERQGDAESQKEFQESVAKSTVAVGDVGGIKKSELPGKEVLYAPGKRDGQTVMVREGDKINCYSWSAAGEQWSAVGEVVGGTGGSNSTSGKVLHEGKEYDFVFDVELDQGKFLKLPYNTCEDPYYAAQRFIERQELPQGFLDQVAQFIIQNTKGVTLGSESSSQFTDPFTGATRYQPGGSSSGENLMVADPFTGSGRYVPSAAQTSTAAFAAADPFTGASRHTPQGTVVSHFFPQLIPLKFEACNTAGILSKLTESNSVLPAESQVPADVLGKLVEAVSEGRASDPHLLETLEKALQWPVEQVWPALDVLRLALLSNEIQSSWLTDERGVTLVNHLVCLVRPPAIPNAQLMSLRCLANLAVHPFGRRALGTLWQEVVSAAVEISPYSNKNLEIAAATVLLNYSVMSDGNQNTEQNCQVLSGVGAIAMCVKDPEAQFRSLVALGTLLHNCVKCRSLADGLDLKPVVQRLTSGMLLPKVEQCAGHIMKLL